ncbi:hypothetical protein [Paramicrobacterium fandaimingii]|uniref:hypothetical protein n=1 Tax=Paramicrobacterium fandaimingii TaxID=2708079 RepID=UPI0014221836|nr:hypothetical protein [Microbacterium fandaimingii]
MPNQPRSAARTTRRRFWFDPRFIIGLVLVIISVTGVWLVVDSQDQTVPVYAAAATLPAGAHVMTDDLTLSRVSLGSLDGRYIREGELPEGDLVTVRTVGDGELIPASAIADAAASAVAPVVIDITGELPESVAVGARVDIWAAAPNEQNGFGQPTVIVDGAVVARVVTDDAMVGQQSTSVEILIPKGDVATVLSAQANGHALSIVPGAGIA